LYVPYYQAKCTIALEWDNEYDSGSSKILKLTITYLPDGRYLIEMQPDAYGNYPYTGCFDCAVKTFKGGPLKFYELPSFMSSTWHFHAFGFVFGEVYDFGSVLDCWKILGLITFPRFLCPGSLFGVLHYWKHWFWPMV
jgi:hypothetical protein